MNKTATRVTLLFDVANSPSLADEVRQRLLIKLANRMDKEGVLQLNVQSSRSQHRNRDTAVALSSSSSPKPSKKKKSAAAPNPLRPPRKKG